MSKTCLYNLYKQVLYLIIMETEGKLSMLNVDCDYNIRDDIRFILESEKINNIDLSEKTGVSRMTLDSIEQKGTARDDVCEKIYSYAYLNNYRINAVKRRDEAKTY